LWVSKRDGTGVVINRTDITSTSFTPISGLAPNQYRAWVRAVTSTGVFSVWSAYVDFTVADNSFDRVRPEELSSILVSVLSHEGQPVMCEETAVAAAAGIPAQSSSGPVLDDCPGESQSRSDCATQATSLRDSHSCQRTDRQ
jgi:hypothetical protein